MVTAWTDCIPSVIHFGLWLHLQALICLIDKKTGEKGQKRPRFVKQDQVCIARLRTAGTICLETFKEFPQMGRFTLRDEGKNQKAVKCPLLIIFSWDSLKKKKKVETC